MNNETSQTVHEGLKSLRVAAEASKQLTSAEAAMRGEHAGMLKERKEIVFGNASEIEVTENIERLVTEEADKWAKTHGVQFVRALGGHSEPIAGPKEVREVAPRLPHFGDLAGTLRFEDLCGLAPSLVKARLEEIVHTSGAKFGLPKAEREAKLKELNISIAEMEETHTKLVRDAAAVGIALPFLDAVAKRREAEELAATRARETAEQRARGEYFVTGAGGRA